LEVHVGSSLNSRCCVDHFAAQGFFLAAQGFLAAHEFFFAAQGFFAAHGLDCAFDALGLQGLQGFAANALGAPSANASKPAVTSDFAADLDCDFMMLPP
jgi:hypothetical protein